VAARNVRNTCHKRTGRMRNDFQTWPRLYGTGEAARRAGHWFLQLLLLGRCMLHCCSICLRHASAMHHRVTVLVSLSVAGPACTCCLANARGGHGGRCQPRLADSLRRARNLRIWLALSLTACARPDRYVCAKEMGSLCVDRDAARQPAAGGTDTRTRRQSRAAPSRAP